MGRRTIGRGVALVAAGMSDFGAFPGKTTRDLFVEAFLDMKGSSDKDFDPADIEALYIGNYSSELFEGQGHEAAEEGLTARHGTNPVNTSGGLKSKGHPVGASGAGQAVEIHKQMRGQAGERQVARDVDFALTHNVGGTGQTCVVHIYERR